MAIYQPTAAVGNSRILATLGGHGELMTFFFPHLDYAQNLREGMPAVYIGRPGLGRLRWCFDPVWQTSQDYLPDTNTVLTRLHHPQEQLEVTFTDLVPPERDLLARLVTVTNHGHSNQVLVVYQYLLCELGETPLKHSVRYLIGRSAAVQYWRSITIAVASDHFDQYQCGKVGAGNSAQADLSDGRLGMQAEEIGQVDLALGWNLNLPGGDTQQRLLVMAAGESEQDALALAQWARNVGFQELAAQSQQACHDWLALARPVQVPPDLGQLYRRCLLASGLLFDSFYGSVLAAPEFDPNFELSGGYGYCWPRDAAEVVCALARAGYPSFGERFFEWADRAQAPAGYWEQRYWLNGERGPSWCTFEDNLQVDQTASVVASLAHYVQMQPAPRRPELISKHWQMVSRATEFLASTITPDNLHSPGSDLWETFRGSFTYSNAAIFAALQGAAHMAGVLGHDRLAGSWHSLGDQVKKAVLSRLWVKDHFAQRITEDGRLDARVDSSALGVVEPFHLLRLDDALERHMAESTVSQVEQRLGVSLVDGPAIRRYEGDDYMGGMPGGVNTLWLVRVLLRLAVAECHRQRGQALAYYHRAQEYLRVVIHRATPTGLLPELISPVPGSPGWAVPHGWAMALYLDCIFLLDQVHRELLCTQAEPHPLATTGG